MREAVADVSRIVPQSRGLSAADSAASVTSFPAVVSDVTCQKTASTVGDANTFSSARISAITYRPVVSVYTCDFTVFSGMRYLDDFAITEMWLMAIEIQ